MRQVPSIRGSVRRALVAADRARMRPSRSVLGTIVLGAFAVLVSLWQGRGVALTPFALFLAAAILIELFEEPERERSRELVDDDRLRLAAAVQIAALLVLGPWPGVLVAAGGTIAGALFRGVRARAALYTASAGALAAFAGGIAFRVAGGHTGSL